MTALKMLSDLEDSIMDKTTQFVLIAKRILRELRILNDAVAVGVKRITEQIDTIRSENERNRHKDEPIKVRTEVVSFDDAIIRERRRDQDRQDATQNSIKRAAWLTFGAVFLYAGVTALQWREMRKATEKAGISADAAISAAKTADVTLKLSMRPYLVGSYKWTDDSTSPRPNASVTVDISFQNIGKTPARAVEEYGCMAIIALPEKGTISKAVDTLFASAKESYDRTFGPVKLSLGMDIAPEDHSYLSYYITNNNCNSVNAKPRILTTKEYNEIASMKKGLVFLGVANYSDSLPGSAYQTDSCWIWLGPTQAIHHCGTHNTIK